MRCSRSCAGSTSSRPRWSTASPSTGTAAACPSRPTAASGSSPRSRSSSGRPAISAPPCRSPKWSTAATCSPWWGSRTPPSSRTASPSSMTVPRPTCRQQLHHRRRHLRVQRPRPQDPPQENGGGADESRLPGGFFIDGGDPHHPHLPLPRRVGLQSDFHEQRPVELADGVRGSGGGTRAAGERRRRATAPHQGAPVKFNSSLYLVLNSIVLTLSGDKVATTSEKGINIRLFNAISGELLQEVRRGNEYGMVYSLAFSRGGNWLCCTSDSSIVHVFAVVPSPEAVPSCTPSAKGGTIVSR